MKWIVVGSLTFFAFAVTLALLVPPAPRPSVDWVANLPQHLTCALVKNDGHQPGWFVYMTDGFGNEYVCRDGERR